jgi:hypothetical protein
MESNGNPLGFEHSDHAGATELARRLREHWLGRDFNIKTKVESAQTGKHSVICGVRSSLVCGLPPAGSKVLAVEPAEAA